MDSLTTAIAQHGYAILIGAVFLEAIGLPVPAALALLIAGAAAPMGCCRRPMHSAAALLAMLAADTLMFCSAATPAGGCWVRCAACRSIRNRASCDRRIRSTAAAGSCW
jgi:membrane protein DedA with SNARE-associated domain